MSKHRDYTRRSIGREMNVRVYCVTTLEDAERIAVDGFQDTDYGARGWGVMVHLAPTRVTTDSLAVVVILIDDQLLEPYMSGRSVCVPAALLNSGYAELVE